jgi:hypothetical protein
MTLPLQDFVDQVGPPIAAAWLNEVDQLRFSVGSGIFTATGVGFSGAPPTMLCTWRVIENTVTLHFASTGLIAPSSSTSFSLTGLPAALIPTFSTQEFRIGAIDNSAEVSDASVQVASSGTLKLLRNGVEAGWTATGNKGFGTATITYLLS